MSQRYKVLSILIICCFCIFPLLGQKNISASGGNAVGSGGSVSYSAGQIIYQNLLGINVTVAQGVQQPYEISIVTGYEETRVINLIYSVYPNPTGDFLTLKVENNNNRDLSYMLLDINGKILENKKVEGNESQISMMGLIPSVYFLKVIDDHKEVKTFKIIKN